MKKDSEQQMKCAKFRNGQIPTQDPLCLILMLIHPSPRHAGDFRQLLPTERRGPRERTRSLTP